MNERLLRVISACWPAGPLEAWAAERAQRDLRALLARAPRTTRRYRDAVPGDSTPSSGFPGDVLMVAPGEVVPVDGAVAGSAAVLDESVPGDVLMVAPGEVVPVDGAVAGSAAVLDESVRAKTTGHWANHIFERYKRDGRIIRYLLADHPVAAPLARR